MACLFLNSDVLNIEKQAFIDYGILNKFFFLSRENVFPASRSGWVYQGLAIYFLFIVLVVWCYLSWYNSVIMTYRIPLLRLQVYRLSLKKKDAVCSGKELCKQSLLRLTLLFPFRNWIIGVTESIQELNLRC